MKNLFIITTATILATSTAFAEIKVYGKAGLSLQQIDDGTDKVWEIEDNSSRFGIKGQHKLNNDLKAIYKYELQIDLADNSSTDENTDTNNHLKARNQYAGIKGNFGKVIIGRHDTPLKKAQGKFDQFKDQEVGDIKNALPSAENRVSGILQYSSPKIANAITANVMLIPGEDSSSGNDGIADATSISVVYKAGSLYLAVALDSDVEAENLDSQFISAGWKGGNFGVNALISTSELDGAEDEEAVGVSAYFKSGNFKFKAQLINTDNFDNGSDDAEQAGFGVDYSLGKNTSVGIYSIDLEIANNDVNNTGIHLVTKF